MSTYTPISYTSGDGLALYARDYAATAAPGAAPGPARLPVICIHGLTRNSSDFDELAPIVAARVADWCVGGHAGLSCWFDLRMGVLAGHS